MTDALTTQVYQVFIKATPEQVWEAITTPEFTARYFHGARIEASEDKYVSHGPDGSLWGDAEVFDWDPPRRLVHGWQSLYDEEMAKEETSRVSWEIEPADGGPPFVGFTLRLFDPRDDTWRIWWSSTRAPGVLDTPVEGRFDGDRGVFEAADTIGGRAALVRFEWLRDQPERPLWQQSFSYDGGTTWTLNWQMFFSRP